MYIHLHDPYIPKSLLNLKKKTNTKWSGPVLTMILFSPLRWHFCFFWILPLPSPSDICDQNHLELSELLAKSFCREGELVAFSWTVEGRKHVNYNCKIYSPEGFTLGNQLNRGLPFAPQFWKWQRKTSLLRKRQKVYLGSSLTALSNLKPFNIKRWPLSRKRTTSY